MAPPACPRAQTRGRALEYPQSEVIGGLGSGLRILNTPTPPVFEESVRYAQQNLYARAAQLVGDRDLRAHELRSFDADQAAS